MIREVIIETFWVCNHIIVTSRSGVPLVQCGRKNLGRDLKCAQCGFERSLSAKEGIDETAPEVTESALVTQFQEEEHWVCLTCPDEPRNRSTGDPTRDICQRCVAPREFGMSVSPAEKAILEPDFDRAREEQAEALHIGVDTTQRALTYALVIAPLLLLVAGLLLFWPRAIHATATAKHWYRGISLQRRTATDHSGWQLPVGAFNTSCVTQQHGTHTCNVYDCSYNENYPCQYDCNPHTESYVCGQEQSGYKLERYSCNCQKVCNKSNCVSRKNGSATCRESCTSQCSTCNRNVPAYKDKYCSRTVYARCSKTCTRWVRKDCWAQCPTYDQWCVYQEWEWPTVDKQHAYGGTNEEPHWPALAVVGVDEQVTKEEKYEITYSNNKGTWTRNVSLGDYTSVVMGTKWILNVAVSGLITSINQERE